MSRLARVKKEIDKIKLEGKEPKCISMGRSFAIAFKTELMPEINKYFINGRMEVDGVPWEIGDIKGFKVK